MNPSNNYGVYATSKASFTQLLQYLADEVLADRCQILSCHPGRIFTEGAAAAGFTENSIEWDSGMLFTSSKIHLVAIGFPK
jgi:NAD(P)-dependent dehydrogenase (short-subunit alcohol dehydrogenase family)